ncbi:energy transducer TonB [Pontibacter oryzae]|uniref:Energy transducer TonB n=1 Tax=Pontibacter oryzae TaxID=2304593 RepID=A0A399SIL8_9BACT|nr:energy transducer TonB [Pontibacter oryzae]RIJ42739.1 energy transducer TonB [Pontibacter oryzae]
MINRNNLLRLTAAFLFCLAASMASPSAKAQSTDKVYTSVEQMPAFEGGQQKMLAFLGQNITYPQDAKAAGVQGLVVITFVVDADGSLKQVQAVKSLTKSTDEEAMRVVKMMVGKWTPGRQSGKAVAVRYTLPIKFAMKETDSSTQQPQFIGGQEAMHRFLAEKIALPEAAKKEHLQAKAVVRFTVEPDGSVSGAELSDMKMKKTIGPGSELDYMDATSFNLQHKTILAQLSEAALTAVKATSGHWKPATQNGKAVAAKLTLPIQFANDAQKE